MKPSGIIVPIVTPIDSNEQVDYAALRQLISHLIDQGIHGIFPHGTTGEFYALTEDEYTEILLVAKDEIAGRVPMFAGASHITARSVKKQIRVCEKVGVDALAILTPMFISQTQNELYAFYKSMAEETDLPITLYNNPPKTGINIAPETVAKLSEIKNIVAVKDSSANMINTAEYIRLTRGNDSFNVLMGSDNLIFAALCYGATGAIASCANVVPKQTADIYDKFMAGDTAGALEAQFNIAPMRIASAELGSFPAAVKEGVCMQGINAGKCYDPVAGLTEAEKSKLRDILIEMGLKI